MSGGHFDYQQGYLIYIIEKLASDIRRSELAKVCEHPDADRWGYCPECLELPENVEIHLTLLIKDLEQMYELLYSYDYYMSGDSDESRFLKLIEERYGKVETITGIPEYQQP